MVKGVWVVSSQWVSVVSTWGRGNFHVKGKFKGQAKGLGFSLGYSWARLWRGGSCSLCMERETRVLRPFQDVALSFVLCDGKMNLPGTQRCCRVCSQQ